MEPDLVLRSPGSRMARAAPEPPPELPVADVVLLSGAASVPDVLTYLVPEELAAAIAVGLPVLAPLGHRESLGYVFALRVQAVESQIRLRPLLGIVRKEPAFDARMAELLRWLAAEYRCSLAEVVGLAAPERHACELRVRVSLAEWDGAVPPRVGLLTRQALAALYQALTTAGGSLLRDELLQAVAHPQVGAALRRARSEGWVSEERVLVPPRVGPRTLQAVRSVASSAVAEDSGRLGPRQRELLEYLAARGDEPVAQRDLQAELHLHRSTIVSLVRRGLVQPVRVRVRRGARAAAGTPATRHRLTPAQAAATRAIEADIAAGSGATHLLFGVTGSGKTEIYLRAIEAARGAGRTAVLLVPEISLTAQVALAVRQRLGESVAILHSALGAGERFDEWERLREGKADVVVGPRSALFAPLANPAVIILDEEHDGSYKQGSSPRYHARTVARRRAQLCGGCVVLGSATPSIESYHAAETGRYRLHTLPGRILDRPLPTVRLVDMRGGTRAAGPAGIFSAQLEDAIRRRLAAREQTILFLNRRGQHSFLLCRECGHVPHCPHCDVSLSLHRSPAPALRCHHCDYLRPAPALCERCRGPRVKPFGLGTQRVEEAARECFPGARIARLDRDTTGARGSHESLVRGMSEGAVDILIGTQMVTKGFDFPRVTLVGVIAADVALHLPDFRAGERCFQLLTQVAGRSGRGETAGEALVQTFNPQHPAVAHATRHDFPGYYRHEVRARQELGYPPFGSLARILAQDPAEEAARARAEAAAALLEARAAEHGVRLLGPAPCPLPRIQDRYRWHLLLKAAADEPLRALLDASWPLLRQNPGGLLIDVDPQDLL